MKKPDLTDEQLVAAIAAGGAGRETALKAIYEDNDLKRMVAAYVRNHQGNATDGQDMFQEGIIALDRNIREGKFRGEAPVKGYLYSICRFLWMNQLRKQAHTSTVAEMPPPKESDTVTPELTMITEERKDMLDRLLQELGERCQKILELWKLSYSMEEIAETLGFSSSDMARKAKYRCHVSLLDIIQKNPHVERLLSR